MLRIRRRHLLLTAGQIKPLDTHTHARTHDQDQDRDQELFWVDLLEVAPLSDLLPCKAACCNPRSLRRLHAKNTHGALPLWAAVQVAAVNLGSWGRRQQRQAAANHSPPCHVTTLELTAVSSPGETSGGSVQSVMLCCCMEVITCAQVK